MKANAKLTIYQGTVNQDVRDLKQIMCIDVYFDTSDGLSIFKDYTQGDVHFDSPAFASITQDGQELLRMDYSLFEAIWISAPTPQALKA